MSSREMEERRKRVKRLLAQGATPAEIAARLECSRSTVYRDLDALDEEVQALKHGEIDEFLRVLLATFETVNTELWRLAHDTGSETLKRKALTEIIRTRSEQVRVFQQVGILDRAADEIQLSGESGDAIEFVVEEYDPACGSP